MFKITILAVGKLKDKNLAALAAEYHKRLVPYAKVEMIEIKAEPFTAQSKAKAQKLEAEKILATIEKYPEATIIISDEAGRGLTSIAWADFLQSRQNEHLLFVIGGALGLAEEIKNKKFLKISLSPMTFTHEFARVILLEQIYRATAIIAGKEYHY